MKQHLDNVKEFMAKAGQSMPATPCTPDQDVLKLRASLIFEECMETIRALGCCILIQEAGQTVFILDGSKGFKTKYEGTPDLEGIADGCADINVVSNGTAIACGIDMEPIQAEVDRANLAKFGPGSSLRSDGKVLKPPGWTPPDIAGKLREQGA